MPNNTLFKIEQDSLLIIFEGAFFDKAMPSYIVERQLEAIRKYGEERGLQETEILVQIFQGSLKMKIIKGVAIFSPIIALLAIDYSQIEKNFNSVSNITLNVVESVFDPVGKNKDSKMCFRNDRTNQDIKSFNTQEAKKILACIPINEPKEEVKEISGFIRGVKTNGRFALKVSKQSEEIILSFTDERFKSVEAIKNQLGKHVEVRGVANINEKGIITSIKVEVGGYKELFHIQDEFSTE